MVGKWDVAGTYYMPGMPPDKQTGTCEYRSILEGRLILQDYQATSEASGFSMTGFGINGFDRSKKKYFTTWSSTMTTGMTVWEGTSDPSGKTFTYLGEDFDPMSGQMKKSKIVTKHESDDKMTMKMFEVDKDGSERLELEITYTRQRKVAAGA